jgi:hypothetical protein
MFVSTPLLVHQTYCMEFFPQLLTICFMIDILRFDALKYLQTWWWQHHKPSSTISNTKSAIWFLSLDFVTISHMMYITWPSCGIVNERDVEANNKSKHQINLHHFCMQIHSPLGYVLLTNLVKDCNKTILDFSRDFKVSMVIHERLRTLITNHCKCKTFSLAN